VSQYKYPCCENNRVEIERTALPGNGVRVVEHCQVCGRKHRILEAEPLAFPLTAPALGVSIRKATDQFLIHW
jgi:hypothetical protein